MKKMNKAILALGTVAAAAAPIATVISCGGADDAEWITNIVKKDKITQKGTYAKSSVTVITDAGKVTDKSFNQSAWEAAKVFGDQAGVKRTYIEPSSEAQIKQAYDTAKSAGSKVWILPGFKHNSTFEAYNFGSSDVAAIRIDGGGDSTNMAHEARLNYLVEQSGFLAGYGVSKYLVDVKKDTDPKIGAWAGANSAGVSNFILGYLAGVAYWNKNNPTNVKFAGNTITLNTGFSAGGGATVASTLKTEGADVLLAVAGPQTADALKVAAGTDIKIVGVDVDQSLAYPDDKTKFITSIEKKIGQSTYDTLCDIYEDSTKVLNHTLSKGLDANWTAVSKTQVAAAKPVFDDITKTTSDIYTKAKVISLPADYADKTVATLTGQAGLLSIAGLVEADWKTLGITSVTA